MIKGNVDLMMDARRALDGKWGLAVGVFFLNTVIMGVAQNVAGGLVGLIIGGPMSLGLALFSMSFARGEEATVNQIFDGFKNFGTALGAYLLMGLFIFLWMLLLIVPGIIAALSYSQVFFIIAEEESIGVQDALKKSKRMMYGYKTQLFYLGLRFFAWSLLCILTLGIGFLWLIPYMRITYVNFYDAIKNNEMPMEEDDMEVLDYTTASEDN